jgi:hypothetical protein
MKQLEKLQFLLTRKSGCTSVDIAKFLPSVCPHKRLSDLKYEGWTITKKKIGKLFVYFGKPPKK